MLAATSNDVLGSPRFEPIRIVGEGGSGVVYEVRVRSELGDAPGRSVALKVLRAELAPSERERRRFLEEAERMQRVRHDGLVRLLEAGLLPDGRPYLAMPLIEGETLAARLRRGPVPAAIAVKWLGVLARAVHALHAAGMVHRDVKPENIVLTGGPSDEEKKPLLLDFGIARDLDGDDATTTTAEGRVRGTPAYMAPERFFGAGASVRSDVYELAVVLYTMLVGRLPWGSEKNVTERLNPASPRDAGADVSSALATSILRALSTRPENRPASAEAFAREVEGAAADATSASRRTLDVPVEEPTPEIARALDLEAKEEPRSSGARTLPPDVPSQDRSRASVVVIGVAFAVAATLAAAYAFGVSSKPAPAAAPLAPTSASAAPPRLPVPVPLGAQASAAAAPPQAAEAAAASAIARPSAEAPPPMQARLPRATPLAKAAAPSAAPSTSAAAPPSPDKYFEDRR
jgi:serine/threonine-protein kinase